MAAGGLGLVLLALGGASAQDKAPPEDHPFAGGTITIAENDDYEKIVTFDGKEIARDFSVFFDRVVEVAGVPVALISAGPGGNACGPAQLLVWKEDGEAVRSLTVGADECGAPPPAVSSDAIYFVPWLMPGGAGPVRKWSPQGGLETAGMLTFTAEPGTGWNDIDPGKLDYPVDAFRNEAFYHAARKLLGGDMRKVATGLLVSSGIEALPSGGFYASGCVPHNCGGEDAFMGVDPKAGKLYFAQQAGDPPVKSWPPLREWPKNMRQAMESVLTR